MSRLRLTAAAFVLAAVVGTGVGLVASFASRDAAANQALPHFHGQASWAPGERRAPVLALRDQTGGLLSLTALRGRTVLLTFLDSHCQGQCPLEGRQLGSMLRAMPAALRPTIVIVGVNPSGDTPASTKRAMTKWRLAGPWQSHWLRGTRQQLAPAWRAYGITVEPTRNDITHGMALYLIDKRGFERAGYLFPFLPNFVALDLRTLGRERT